ncbi:MAG TPA: glycerol kinase GlpK [Myxococcaceae bacterium]|jgi:glycerol kinase|nr:glycerol kinase GlpK [Myxococcaceae bacterium]
MAKRRYILAVDQGTTGTHVTVLDDRLKIAGQSYREFPQVFPQPGWVEHDLEAIWRSVERCIAKGLKDAGIDAAWVSAVGITNQRETTGLWRRDTSQPVHRAIVWQDRRTAEACAALKARGEEPRVRERTGLLLDPYFSATKLAWLLDHVEGARARAEKGELCFGTIDTWLVWRFTGGTAHVTDASNASRTLLFDIHRGAWDEELCALFAVPPAVLPEVKGSAEVYGVTRGCSMLPDGIPVAGMAGDQQAALFGQACFSPGESKCTYGTGAFLLMNTGGTPVASRHGLLTTVAWRVGGETTYALEGSSFVAGAAVQWLRDGLGLIRKARKVEDLARQVPDSGGVVFVPALAGLGAPHWRPEARGLLLGLDRGTTAAHVARAVLEGIALQTTELAEAMRRDSGHAIPFFKVDGGAAGNDLLMQIQADLLDVPVVRPRNLETTSLGAALLAGLGSGHWSSLDDIRGVWKAERTFKPKMTPEARAAALARWQRAVERA